MDFFRYDPKTLIILFSIMTKNIIMTGGCGFIGHHFVEHIINNTDWNIIILDKLSYASSGLDRLRDTGCLDNKRD